MGTCCANCSFEVSVISLNIMEMSDTCVTLSLWFYLGIGECLLRPTHTLPLISPVILWIIQVQCILQIIITRIALLAFNKTLIWRLKWGVFIVVLVINISVGCIWIPARLQISHTWMQLNKIWDRLEKSVLAVVDAGLNAYFIYLVRSNLISYGLTKYVRLYRFNIAMIGVSLTMDVRSRTIFPGGTLSNHDIGSYYRYDVSPRHLHVSTSRRFEDQLTQADTSSFTLSPTLSNFTLR